MDDHTIEDAEQAEVDLYAEQAEVWKRDGNRPFTFNEDGRPNIWWYLFALPMIWIGCAFHFTLCSLLTIFVHPYCRRMKIYEYYSPWGWGQRLKRCPHCKADTA